MELPFAVAQIIGGCLALFYAAAAAATAVSMWAVPKTAFSALDLVLHVIFAAVGLGLFVWARSGRKRTTGHKPQSAQG